MINLRNCAALLSAVLLTGCSSFDTRYTAEAHTDFSRYRTFSWYDDGFSEKVSDVFGVNAASLDSTINETITGQLRDKGFTPAQADAADLWVNYEFTTQAVSSDLYQYSLDDLNQTYRQKQIRYSSSTDGSRRYTTVYEQNRFYVDVIDRENLHVIWRGEIDIAVIPNESEERRLKRTKKAFVDLLAQFPPQ